MNNKSFCSLAFNHVSVRPDGVARLCCNTRDSINDDNGMPYNLGHHNIEDILNSNYYKNVRQRMLEGMAVKDCASCIYQEQYTDQSPRILYNRDMPAKNIKINIDFDDVVYLDLRFGNLCNLKCMSCGPHSSSQIDKEVKQLADTNKNILNFHDPLDFDINAWYQTEIFQNNLKKIQNNLTTIYLTGGEPTIVEENFNFMKTLVENNTSKNLSLKFSTNLTNINSEFAGLIKNFKNVIMLCSIDGVGSMQEYLRYPSNWKTIDTNLRKLLDLSNVKLTITPVVQNINLEYITDLFEYVESINRQKNKLLVKIYPQILFGPKHLNLHALPTEYRKYCWGKIESWISNCQYQDDLFFEKMEQIKNICHDDKFNHNNLISLKTYIELYNDIRPLRLEQVNPKLYKILSSI